MRKGCPGRDDDGVELLQKTLVLKEGLELPQEEPRLLGDQLSTVVEQLVDRLVEASEVEPGDGRVREILDEPRLLRIGCYHKQALILERSSEPDDMALKLLAAERVELGLDLEKVVEAGRDRGIGNRSGDAADLVGEPDERQRGLP